jgi:speckle-type POZ protein
MNHDDERFERMFKTQADSDLKLKMKDGKTLKAHKEVLVKRSPEFYLKINPEKGFALIPDFDSETIKELLRFLYCGKVKNLKKVVLDLYLAANEYQLLQLKEICKEYIDSKK